MSDSDEENYDHDIVLLFYLLMDDFIHCDIYLKGQIQENYKKYYKEVIEEFFYSSTWEKKNKYHATLAQIELKEFHNEDTIMRYVNFHKFKPDDLNKIKNFFIPVEKSHCSKKMIRFVKKVINQKLDYLDISVESLSSDEEEVLIPVPSFKEKNENIDRNDMIKSVKEYIMKIDYKMTQDKNEIKRDFNIEKKEEEKKKENKEEKKIMIKSEDKGINEIENLTQEAKNNLNLLKEMFHQR